MTAVDLCRVSVQAFHLGSSAAVDLSLPTRLELGEILPCIVDLVGGPPVAAGNDFTKRWMLSRLDGSTLDESMTLHENGVHDGDVLLLTAGTPIPEPNINDLCQYVVQASLPAGRESDWPKRLGALACLWSVAAGATVLVWPGPSAPGSRAEPRFLTTA